MAPYRVFLSSRVNPSVEDLSGDDLSGEDLFNNHLSGEEQAARAAIDDFAPIAVPSASEAVRASSGSWPNFYIDGLNVSDAFVLVLGSRIPHASNEPALAFCRPSQFRETDVPTFLKALEMKCDFEALLRSLDARYDRTRDGRIAPVKLAPNLEGKTICLYRGGGIGDAVHYVRYALALRSRGARVIVVSGAREAPLLACADGVDAVFPGGECSVCDPVLPDLPECDLGISFVAVPFTCGLRGGDIAWSGPYIRVNSERIDKARHLLGPSSTLKVGLCWESGGGGERAIPISELFPLLRAHADGVEFINLQRGTRQADVHTAREAGISIRDPETAESSLLDTAAIISNLDLVISVDTMICHLAGALGKPVWTMLAHTPDWRWSLDRDDTPWYPSMRLFRRRPDMRHEPVVERISRELARFRLRQPVSTQPD